MDPEPHESEQTAGTLDAPVPRSFELFSRAQFVVGLGWLVACIAPRFLSRWPLEWMEGGTLQHALRLVQGKALYAPPSAEFIAFVYPPLAYVPMGLATWAFEPQLWAARVVSLVALVCALLALFRAGRHAAGPAAGYLAAGLYAVGYGYCGAFFDLVRVDAVFMALVLWGTERLTAGRTRAALAFFVLACFAKQHGLLFLLAASVWILWRSVCRGAAQRAELRALVVAWFALALAVIGLQLWSDGWFLTYVWSVPRSHGLISALLVSFLAVDLALYLPVLCALAGWAIVRRRREPLACDWLLAAAVVASALGRAHPGGNDNVRLPAYALLALVAAVAGCEAAARWRGRGARSLLSLAFALQTAMLVQSPALFWPSPLTAQRFEQLRAGLQRCAAEGGGSASDRLGVAPDHTGSVGGAFAHTMAWYDLTRTPGTLARQTNAALQARLRDASAPSAVALSEISAPWSEFMRGHYVYCADVLALTLPTGYAPGPTRVFRRSPR